MSRLFAIVFFAFLITFPPCVLPGLAAPAEEAGTRDGTIYTWTDEHGVVHMRDKKPDHLREGMTRMEQREQFLQKHPEARNKTQAITSGKSQLPDDTYDSETQPSQDPFQSFEQDATSQQQPSAAFPSHEFQQHQPLSPLQMMLAMGVPLLIGILFYVATSYVLYRVGRKFGIGSFLGYLVPIYNIVLLCRCAGLSGWFVLFLFVPIINIFVTFLIWGKIAERLGKNMVIWGLLCTILGLPVLVLAFDSSMPVMQRRSPRAEPPEDQPNVHI